MGRNQVDRHPKRDEIIDHLVSRDLSVREISERYGVTVDALNWYKKKYLKPRLQRLEDEVVEEIVGEEREKLRRLFVKYRDILDAILAAAVEDVRRGRIKATTVRDVVKLVDMVTRLTGDQVVSVEMKQAWGTKVEGSPRVEVTGKGRVYTMEDLEKMR